MKSKPFRGLGAILFKEFIVVWRDPMTLFFMFFPPLIEMVAFGYALDNDVKHMAMIILDEDRTVESRQLVDHFVNTETFRVVGEVQSEEAMKSEMRKGRAYVGLEIPPTFTRDVRAGRDRRGVANWHNRGYCHGPRSRAGTRNARATTREPVKPRGSHARQTCALLVHRNGHGGDSFPDYALCVRRAHRRQCDRDDVFDTGLRVRSAQSWFACRNEGRKPNAGAANVDGVPVAERFLFRLHFSAGNHAVDFLRTRCALPNYLFHRAHARDHSARCKFVRILAAPRHPHSDVDLAFCFLRTAVSEEACVSSHA